MSTVAAQDVRLALRVIARTLNQIADSPKDWRQLSPREHLTLASEAAEKELVGSHGGDHLAEAAARLLLALQRRQFQQRAEQQSARPSSSTADGRDKIVLRHSVD